MFGQAYAGVAERAEFHSSAWRRLEARLPSWSTSLSKERSAKSLLESRVVAYGSEVVVCSRLLAERREQLA